MTVAQAEFEASEQLVQSTGENDTELNPIESETEANNPPNGTKTKKRAKQSRKKQENGDGDVEVKEKKTKKRATGTKRQNSRVKSRAEPNDEDADNGEGNPDAEKAKVGNKVRAKPLSQEERDILEDIMESLKGPVHWETIARKFNSHFGRTPAQLGQFWRSQTFKKRHEDREQQEESPEDSSM